MIYIIGYFMNAIRGGQHKDLLWGDYEDKLPWFLNGDLLNASVYALLCLYLTSNIALSVLCGLFMYAGASKGYGHYNQVLAGKTRKGNGHFWGLDSYVSRLVGGYNKVWAFIMLAFRGVIWGLCLCIPFWVFSEYIFFPILAGLLMPSVYTLFIFCYSKNKLGNDMAWQSWERVFGLLLWGSVIGSIN